MKKGFTLVELLAVILLLGVIALISMPMINNVVKEAKYNIYKTNNDNIIKSVKQDCKTRLSIGDAPLYAYTFNEGKSSINLNIKGDLPNDGYIFLNDECNVENYYFENNDMFYANTEDIREDYMLKAPITSNQSLFKDLYFDAFNNIVSVNFINNLDIPNNAILIKDPSVSEKGKIKSWLVPNGDKYDLYIGSLKKIYANYDSSNLFRSMFISDTDFSNFDTSFSKKMTNMFYQCKYLLYLDLGNFNTANVTDMSQMFYESTKIKDINVSNFITDNVTRMFAIFQYCYALENINVSNWDVSNIKGDGIQAAFSHCQNLKKIDLSNWKIKNISTLRHTFNNCATITELDITGFDTSNVTDFYATFSDLKSMKKLDLTTFNTSSATNMNYMFDGIEIGNGLQEIKGLENFDLSNLKLAEAMFADSRHLKEIKLSNASTTNLSSIHLYWGDAYKGMFENCNSLEYLDLGNLDMTQVADVSRIFNTTPNIKTVKYNHAPSIKRLIEYFPTKDINNIGTLIIDDKTKLLEQEISVLNSKNWNVI